MCVQVGVRDAVRCPRELVDFLLLATSSCVRSFSETQSSMARIYPALTVGPARSRALPRTGLCASLSSVKGRARHPQTRTPRLRALGHLLWPVGAEPARGPQRLCSYPFFRVNLSFTHSHSSNTCEPGTRGPTTRSKDPSLVNSLQTGTEELSRGEQRQ